MMIDVVLVAGAVLLASAAAAAALRRFPLPSAAAGAGGAVAGALIGLAGAIGWFGAGEAAVRVFPWSMPLGSLTLGLDGLSAFFLVVIFGLAAPVACYGFAYLPHAGSARAPGQPQQLQPGHHQPHADASARTGLAWCWFNLLIASMAAVVTARNGLFFLLAWELMSLSSFFLVAHESEKETVRKAAWTYLVATHLGVACLLAMFVLMGTATGSLDFDKLALGTAGGRGFLDCIFVLALIGFGTKAGFFPFHVWLPEAHPAAPSHVSALLSGAMIKTGLYALLRTMSFLGEPQPWWGWLLVGIGAASGILGVVFALAQHDLKRLLAYSSVENVGIATLGLGLGVLGWCAKSPVLAALGFAGAFLHIINHAVFKGLLFLCAGSVLHATGTRTLDRLGGLLARMPATGLAFLVGATAICGLPPFNGFIGEFLIYLGAFKGITLGAPGLVIPATALIAALALIGGLAAVCFAKAFGIAFLGEPRSAEAAHAHEAPAAMRLPMLILAALCLALGFGAYAVVPALAPVVAAVTGTPAAAFAEALADAQKTLFSVALVSAVFVLFIALAAIARRALLAGRPVARAVTWDCGYARPTARMQYTGSSFVQPVVDLFKLFLQPAATVEPPEGFFPTSASLATRTDDTARERVFAPVFVFVNSLFSHMRWVQEGRVHIYVLYVALTLLALLVFVW
jgi:hydrogenase-4 component B